jgi:oxygen-independent coproporphyrinogen-3 oxidase
MINPGLYIHIPFCTRKCPYCDFYSVSDLNKVSVYLDALSLELKRVLEGEGSFRNSVFDSVFLGGGSPSVLNHSQLQILKNILSPINIAKDAEITIEANPEDIEREKLLAWKAFGVNRLSIGAQSLSSKGLVALGRRHNVGHTLSSLSSAKDLGFNISLDLIFGWPGETLKDLEFDLESFLKLGVKHLSLYCLTVAEGTELYHGLKSGLIKSLPNEELVSSLFLWAGIFLQDNGFHRYEVSNFASPGCECHHNLKYWNRVPYLGLGPSAHSFDGTNRSGNFSDILSWAMALHDGKSQKEFTEGLSEDLERLERLFLGLRQSTGVDMGDIGKSSKAAKLVEEGFLILKRGRFIPTEKGFLSADYLARELC